jgi:hypothetical protein
MRIETVRCQVLGTNVTRVVDFEGAIDRVICPEYKRPDGSCRLKRAAGTGGPLSRLVARVDDDMVTDGAVMCGLR